MALETQKLVPELRFPEFGEDWKPVKLIKNTSKIGSGKTPRGGELVYQDFRIPFIRSQNVLDNQLIIDKTHIPFDLHEDMSGSKV